MSGEGLLILVGRRKGVKGPSRLGEAAEKGGAGILGCLEMEVESIVVQVDPVEEYAGELGEGYQVGQAGSEAGQGEGCGGFAQWAGLLLQEAAGQQPLLSRGGGGLACERLVGGCGPGEGRQAVGADLPHQEVWAGEEEDAEEEEGDAQGSPGPVEARGEGGGGEGAGAEVDGAVERTQRGEGQGGGEMCGVEFGGGVDPPCGEETHPGGAAGGGVERSPGPEKAVFPAGGEDGTGGALPHRRRIAKERGFGQKEVRMDAEGLPLADRGTEVVFTRGHREAAQAAFGAGPRGEEGDPAILEGEGKGGIQQGRPDFRGFARVAERGFEFAEEDAVGFEAGDHARAPGRFPAEARKPWGGTQGFERGVEDFGGGARAAAGEQAVAVAHESPGDAGGPPAGGLLFVPAHQRHESTSIPPFSVRRR